jgi:malate permease and related proteins
MLALNTLVPLLAIVLLGAVLRRTRFASAGLFRETNRLLYWIALPALLFEETATAEIGGDAALRVAGVILIATAACIGVGYLVAWLLRLPRHSVGAFVQGGFRGNLAYVGLPAITLALAGSDGAIDPEVRTLAVLALALIVPIYNIVAVVVLVASGGAAGQPPAARAAYLRKLGVALVTNPFILACLAGLLIAVSGWDLPTIVARTCATLGQMTTPLALLGVGATLSLEALRGRWTQAAAAALVKVAVAPLVGYLLVSALGLAPLELRIAMIYLATPTATASYVMAGQLGSDEQLAGAVIVLSTILSLPALAISLIV